MNWEWRFKWSSSPGCDLVDGLKIKKKTIFGAWIANFPCCRDRYFRYQRLLLVMPVTFVLFLPRTALKLPWFSFDKFFQIQYFWKNLPLESLDQASSRPKGSEKPIKWADWRVGSPKLIMRSVIYRVRVLEATIFLSKDRSIYFTLLSTFQECRLL